MTSEMSQSRVLRFGLYEADLASRELRREGVPVRLQERPFEILAILLESQGAVVAREELRKRLWPADTFVDFDSSLNTSINKLRQALGDSAENPRFIATVGRRGYRFIAPVGPIQEETGAGNPSAAQPEEVSKQGRLGYGLAGISILALIAVAALFMFRQLPDPKVLSLEQISRDGLLDPWGKLATDGARIFYLDRNGGHWTLMQVPAAGGEGQPFPEPSQNIRVVDVSPDRSELLSFPFHGRSLDLPLSLTPVVGGPTRQVGAILADDAVFSRDGSRIFFSRGDGIYSSLMDGSQVQKLVALPGTSWDLAWSKDGRRLRFTIENREGPATSIWEVGASGGNLHRVSMGLPLSQSVCCGRWSTDGRYFFFESLRDHVSSVWAIRDSGRIWPARNAKPVQLTFGPVSYGGILPGEDPRKVYVWGGSEQIGTFLYSPQSASLRPFLPNIRTRDMALSADGSRLAYWADDTIWISDAEGGNRRKLLTGWAGIDNLVWRPDGKRLLVHGRRGAETPEAVIVSVDGGAPETVPLGEGNLELVYSPDGGRIVFARRENEPGVSASQSGIFIYDLQTARIERIPGSEHFVHPMLSPDSRLLAATTNFDENPSQPTKVMLYDFGSGSWKQIGAGTLVNPVQWSSDSKFFFYQDVLGDGEPAFRYSMRSGKAEFFVDFAGLVRSGYARCSWKGFVSNGDFVMSLRREDTNVYRLNLDLP